MKSPKECTHTKGGAPFRFYADDAGGDFPVHGAIYDQATKRWFVDAWKEDGRNVTVQKYDLDLTDWRDLIPWECIRPEIKFVARDKLSKTAWYGYKHEPERHNSFSWNDDNEPIYSLEGLNMPEGPEDWTQSLVKRPTKENE